MRLLSSILKEAPENNAVRAARALVKLLKVDVSRPTIKKTIEEHPDYPSLLSVSDALTAWKIENVCLKTELKRLRQFTPPFITYMANASVPYFSVVKELTEKGVIVSNDSTGESFLAYSDFEKQWGGVLMIAESNSTSGELDFKRRHRIYQLKRAMPLTLILIFTALFALITGQIAVLKGFQSWPWISLFWLKLIGIGIGLMLLWYEVDNHNTGMKSVCKSTNNVNCHAVLQSSGAKILGITSWSEIGSFYFLGSFLFLLGSDFSASSLHILAWLNILALPYVFFSIYYQWQVVRQWCILCVAVQMILVAEFLINIFGNQFSSSDITLYDVAKCTFYFLLPATVWFSLKPLMADARDAKGTKTEFNRLKHNGEIFESLLSRQKDLEIPPTGLGITLGNPSGKIKLIKVCNPYCGPCAKAHPEIDDLLHNIPELQVQIIFTASNQETDMRSKPVRHLLAIADKKDETLTKRALDDWYNASVKDYDAFAGKYALKEELMSQSDKLDAMQLWCNNIGIRHTPTFYLQGHELPRIYQIKDLKYFLSN